MAELAVETVRLPLRAPLRTAWGTLAERELVRVRLRFGPGDAGEGEAAPLEPYDGVPLAAVLAALDAYAAVLADAGPEDDAAALLEACRAERPLPQALAAIDLALWDRAGRRAGRPVAALLGGDAGEPIAVNALVGAEDRAGAARAAAEAAAAGFACVKVKVGIGDDAGRLAAVRAAVGRDVAIRADANGAWGSPREALANLRALAPVGIELCEEPVHGLEALREVRAESPVPIAIDESAAELGGGGAAGTPGWDAADAVCLQDRALRRHRRRAPRRAGRPRGRGGRVPRVDLRRPARHRGGPARGRGAARVGRAAPLRARHARRVRRGRRRAGARNTRGTPRSRPARGCDARLMSTEILRYAAFTDTPEGGNPAGVVLDASGLDDAEMQAIAADVGYSETAFVTAADDHDLTVRYFSPLAEVPFCGHATIATGVAWGDRNGDGLLKLTTPAGLVEVDVDSGVATLTSVAPSSAPIEDADLDELLAALRLDARRARPRSCRRGSATPAPTTRSSARRPRSASRTSTTTSSASAR